MEEDVDTPDCFGSMDAHYDDGCCQECQFERECAEFTSESIGGLRDECHCS